MNCSRVPLLSWLANGLLALFVFDRIWKLLAVVHFFWRRPPPPPLTWPSVTLLQPITRGASELANNLRSRLLVTYAGRIDYLFICDAHDLASQTVCADVLQEFSYVQGEIILVETDGYTPASKVGKLLAAIPQATGEICWFLDDDVAVRPYALQAMLPSLLQPGVGAVFGLACYTNWHTLWSSLMSVFVNANALLSYIPMTYLTPPFTITGHCFALRRETLYAVGGFSGLEQRIDDDHELARRLRRAGWRCVQTAMIYDVDNALGSAHAYIKQVKRWFIIPRQTMVPFLTAWEQGMTVLGSFSQFLPGLLALLAICTFRRSALKPLATCLGLFSASYAFCELCYLRRRTPPLRWLLVPLMALLAPAQILWALLSNEEIEWRGQQLRLKKGGKVEVLR